MSYSWYNYNAIEEQYKEDFLSLTSLMKFGWGEMNELLPIRSSFVDKTIP